MRRAAVIIWVGVLLSSLFGTGTAQAGARTNRDIGVVNVDGSGAVTLTTGASDFLPVWSPDGTRIVFVRDLGARDHGVDADPEWEVFVMNADGTGVTNLTNTADFDTSPAWSPDGRRIAFDSVRDGPRGVYVMNPDGSGPTRLTPAEDAFLRPVWSPDGARLALMGPGSGDYDEDVYTMNADGSALRRLAPSEGMDDGPVWSPDGTRIAFSSTRDDPGTEFDADEPDKYQPGRGDIFVMNADGTGVTNLTRSPAVEGFPAWSPDGTRIVFRAISPNPDSEEDTSDLLGVNADGSGLINLTRNPNAEGPPRWSPDGSSIAFSCEEEPFEAAICVMNADGSAVKKVTNRPGQEFEPAWSPDGTRIVFRNETVESTD